MKAYQKRICEQYREIDPRSGITSLNLAYVVSITKEMAQSIILKYEWLGTLGRAIASYGLLYANELIGAVTLGWPAGPESRDVCGKEYRDLAICLERGACVHWAPKNSASYLIARATRLAMKEHGWKIFYAYADEEAGEIGTIYQACNWFYIGRGVGRNPKDRTREYFVAPDGEKISERTLRRRSLKKSEVLSRGWRVIHKMPKHKYIWFEGSKSEKRHFIRKCRYKFLPYPKRVTAIDITRAEVK